MGQEVMVVASDEGPLNAALCTFELLTCAPYIKEIIFAGSAGFSSQVGNIQLSPFSSLFFVPHQQQVPLTFGDERGKTSS